MVTDVWYIWLYGNRSKGTMKSVLFSHTVSFQPKANNIKFCINNPKGLSKHFKFENIKYEFNYLNSSIQVGYEFL